MRLSTKPCPGCGAKGAYRKADECCGDCKTAIKEAKARRLQVARLKDTEGVKLPFAPHCLPPIHYFRDFGRGADVAVGHFVFDLVKLVGQEVDWQQIREPERPGERYLINGPSGCDSGGTTYWLIPRGLKRLLNDVYAAIQTGAEFARADGKEEGRSLILGLATGEVSINEFNEATVGPELVRKGRAAARKKKR